MSFVHKMLMLAIIASLGLNTVTAIPVEAVSYPDVNANVYTNVSRMRNTTEIVIPTDYPAPSKMGVCDIKEYVFHTSACQRKFFLSFREDVEVDCGENTEDMIECVMDEIKSCQIEKEELHIIKKSMDAQNNIISKIFCGNLSLVKMEHLIASGIESSLLLPSSMCKDGYTNETMKCMKPFLKAFHANKGDPALCGSYDKLTNGCIRNVVTTFCGEQIKSTYMNMSWIFSKHLNPYCNESQLKDVKEDPFKLYRKGNNDEADHEDHDEEDDDDDHHNTDHEDDHHDTDHDDDHQDHHDMDHDEKDNDDHNGEDQDDHHKDEHPKDHNADHHKNDHPKDHNPRRRRRHDTDHDDDYDYDYDYEEDHHDDDDDKDHDDDNGYDMKKLAKKQ